MTLTTEQREAYTAERDRLTNEIAGIDAAMAGREHTIAVVEKIREQLAAKFARLSPVGSRAAMNQWDNYRLALEGIDFGINRHETALPIDFVLDRALREAGLASFPGPLPFLRGQLEPLRKQRLELAWQLQKILRSFD